jgi:hypothetical protein
MKHKPAIYALERLHAELSGEIITNRKRTVQLAAGIRHVEAVIRMLEPEFNLRGIAARRKNLRNPFFKRGTIFRSVQGILREATVPMTTRQIVEKLFRQRGIEKPKMADVRGMVGAVHSSLKNHQGKTVESVGEGMPAKWALTA